MAWMDPSGLYQKYGLEQVVPQAAGEFRTPTNQRMIELRLDLTTLGATDANLLGTDDVFFPKGFRIDSVEVEVETAATGASSTLDIGLIQTDRSTVTAAQGILAAFTLANLTPAGKTTVLTQGSATAGTLVGSTTAQVNQLSGKYGTAAFTAGVVIIRIKFSKPG